jgi:hypothetical protein
MWVGRSRATTHGYATAAVPVSRSVIFAAWNPSASQPRRWARLEIVVRKRATHKILRIGTRDVVQFAAVPCRIGKGMFVSPFS